MPTRIGATNNRVGTKTCPPYGYENIATMSRYRRAATPGASYFFTVVTYKRQPILCEEPMRRALRAAIDMVRATRPFAIDAWILLPDHLHCIWTLPEGDADFSTRWKMIKRAVSITCRDLYHRPDWVTASRQVHRESTIWQRRLWEHEIRSEEYFARHVDYIHFNPVKHGYAQCVADWPHSTFHRYVDDGIYPRSWSGGVERDLLEYD